MKASDLYKICTMPDNTQRTPKTLLLQVVCSCSCKKSLHFAIFQRGEIKERRIPHEYRKNHKKRRAILKVWTMPDSAGLSMK